MDAATQERICKLYWDFWNRGQEDPEYAMLRAEAQRLEGLYAMAVKGLSEEQREAVELYIACRESMGRRMLEFVCGEIAGDGK